MLDIITALSLKKENVVTLGTVLCFYHFQYLTAYFFKKDFIREKQMQISARGLDDCSVSTRVLGIIMSEWGGLINSFVCEL